MTKKHDQLSASPTPNPNAVKFLPNMHFFESGTVEFQKDSEFLNESELAKELFKIEGLDIIMIGFNFISVTKFCSFVLFSTCKVFSRSSCSNASSKALRHLS